MTSQLQQQLTQDWSAIYKHIAAAVEWLDDVSPNAPRLNNRAKEIKLELYRYKNLANSLRRVAGTPMAIGFFGLSQAGKSYLISALAANESGDLITSFGGEKLDFIRHVNPAGGGKEATGLVTRFSRLAKESPDPGYPVELQLFREIELAMILSNSWANDFDQDQIDFVLDEQLIQEHLDLFTHTQKQAPNPKVITPADIVALNDYTNKIRASVTILADTYWPTAIELVPYLSLEDRAQFFSLLWGQQPTLTQVYIRLAQTLAQLDHAQTVYAELDCLVQKTEQGFTQTKSIMNVDTLNDLGTQADTVLNVRPQIEHELLPPVAVKTAELTALVSEMTFKLIESPQDTVVEQVDLLDFPGYRSRLNKPNTTDLEQPDSDFIAQLLLRGKVAYLFERYTTFQEMNGLIMCTNSTQQSDVVGVDTVLTQWIHKTQGATPEERAQRQPGLMWAMTMMDNFIDAPGAETADLRAQHCAKLTYITLIERFGYTEWLQNWDGQPFNNTYFVRKPRLKVSFIALDKQGNETHIQPDAQERLNDFQLQLANDPSIQKHVANPEQAWAALMQLNDGGIQRLGQGIAKIADPSFKLKRIKEQLTATKQAIKSLFITTYTAESETALTEQKDKGRLVIESLRDSSMLQKVGELMQLLALEDEAVYKLYIDGQSTGQSSSNDTSPHTPDNSPSPIDFGGFDIDIDFFDQSESSSPTTLSNNRAQSDEELFAQEVYSQWLTHLTDLADNTESALYQLNIPNASKVIPVFIDELITASSRLNLLSVINNKLLEISQAHARREQPADRYTMNAQLAIQDFIAYLGYDALAFSERPKNRQGQALFDFTITAEGALPQLSERPNPPQNAFLSHWFVGLWNLIIDNAGHNANQEISSNQNAQLGSILRNMGVL